MPIIVALILALGISFFFLKSYKCEGFPLYSFTLVFLVLFLAGLASQFWIIPFGSVLLGVSWLPLLFIMMLFTFLLIIIRPLTQQGSTNEKKTEQTLSATTVFVWPLGLLLFIIVFIGFYNLSVYR